MLINRSLGEIAELIDAQLVGSPDMMLFRLWPLADALPNDLSFYTSPKYKRYLGDTQAGALIVGLDTRIDYPNLLRVRDPNRAIDQLAEHSVEQNPEWLPEIHPTAQIDPGVHIYPKVRIGKNVRIKSGAVIGSPGFGFHREQNQWHRIPQMGSVVIEDDVEIGANTCIDRARIGETRIGRGTKIDNLVQIGHGVQIGQDCLICACTGIAGGTRVGHRVIMGGACGIADGVSIVSDVVLAASSGVFQDISEAGMYCGRGVLPYKDEMKCMAIYRKLPSLVARKKL